MVRQFSEQDCDPWSWIPRTVHRCLMNMVTNAIDACIFDPDVDKDHQVTVVTAKGKAEHHSLRRADNGCGMSEEVKPSSFPLFSVPKGSREPAWACW
jgi:C4-dicarboxylate-specific signal transduction histidine kinase